MIEAAASKKIILLELDIGQQQFVWFNYSAFTWYVDFDAIYDLIDPAFLAGVGAQAIVNVGSVSSGASPLRAVSSIAEVQAEENTFYWEAGTRRVYLHLFFGDEPSLHRLILGVVYGITNHEGVYGGMFYEGRLKSSPAIAKNRDPLFYGRQEFGGGTLTIDNADGFFDTLAEEQDVFGNSLRILLGFDDEDRSVFRQIYLGTVGTVSIGQEVMEIQAGDGRQYLSTRIPDKQFLLADYPNLKPENEGKSIPIGYGTMRNVPVVCTNEAESPAPANYTFKLFDMTHHIGIYAITTVRVKGVVKTPSASSLVNATFSLAAADYSPGDRVTVDCDGYTDSLGDLIENAQDVIADILDQWAGIPYAPSAYNQPAWALARLSTPAIGFYANQPTEINQIIEDIALSARGIFFIDRFGKYTFRLSGSGYPSQILDGHDVLNPVTVEYFPDETLGVVQVAYSRDWDAGESLQYRDDSMRAAMLEKYKVANEKTFETLLTTLAAAQEFATGILRIASSVLRRFSVALKLQDQQRELGDIIRVPLLRRGGVLSIGTVDAEVIGVSLNLSEATQTLKCRVLVVCPPSIYVEGGFYSTDEMYYRDPEGAFYGKSGEVAA